MMDTEKLSRCVKASANSAPTRPAPTITACTATKTIHAWGQTFMFRTNSHVTFLTNSYAVG